MRREWIRAGGRGGGVEGAEAEAGGVVVVGRPARFLIFERPFERTILGALPLPLYGAEKKLPLYGGYCVFVLR
jgi:hypothetical protein